MVAFLTPVDFFLEVAVAGFLTALDLTLLADGFLATAVFLTAGDFLTAVFFLLKNRKATGLTSVTFKAWPYNI